MLGMAIALMATEFKDKKDKGGVPYALHCLHVMYKMPADDEDLRIIAVLHDLIEDTKYTLDDLQDMGFSERVIWGVQALTHIPNMPYMEYIKLISFNADATAIKLADLDHNSRILRMKSLRKKDFERLEKYHTAYTYLKS